MGPVFLFDMGVIVFVVSSASGELDGLFSFGKVSLEVIIEELSAVVAIEPEDRKRESVFDILDLFQDTCFTLSPDSSLFGPTGSDVYEVDGIDIHSGGGITAMGNSIGFEEARGETRPIDWS
jgi:hypothetical protein